MSTSPNEQLVYNFHPDTLPASTPEQVRIVLRLVTLDINMKTEGGRGAGASFGVRKPS